jgi:hypothetical protein
LNVVLKASRAIERKPLQRLLSEPHLFGQADLPEIGRILKITISSLT